METPEPPDRGRLRVNVSEDDQPLFQNDDSSADGHRALRVNVDEEDKPLFLNDDSSTDRQQPASSIAQRIGDSRRIRLRVRSPSGQTFEHQLAEGSLSIVGSKRKRDPDDETRSPRKRVRTDPSGPGTASTGARFLATRQLHQAIVPRERRHKRSRSRLRPSPLVNFTRANALPEIASGRAVTEQSDRDISTGFEMGPIKENSAKRKATEEPGTPSESKRLKSSTSHSPNLQDEAPPNAHFVSFPEKPAETEERLGEIEFRVVNNDNARESLIILTGLKNIFQKQLPKMPKDYIARLVYDRTHLSMAIVKHPLEVVGGITYRPFKGRTFAEIVFCAISSDQQVKGYGAHLMSHLKDYVKATSDVMHFLTYADNYAIGYFKKQGFTKEITLDRALWMGYIKDYEGGTIMQCSMLPRVRYLESRRMLLKQKEAVHAKIRAFSKSHEIHAPPKEWANGVRKIDPMSIPAIKASGWSPDMDELARQPRHGPNYNQLLHLLNDMQNHASAWPFQHPVNREEVADYYEVIKEPMDLSTMEAKLEADNYQTPEDFVRDAKLVFDNCRKYNNETTPYAKCANKLEKFMWTQIKAVPEWSHLEP